MRLLAGAFVAALGAAPAQAWWNAAWTARRAVTVPDYKPSKLPGDDIAVVTLPTGGLAKPDGSDVRVATAEDNEVPCRVLMDGPADQVRVAFALRGAGRYYVYFGNPKADAPKEKLDIRRGVLLEMWGFPGGPFRTLGHVQDVFYKAKNLLGRDFRDRIWNAHNPFGPQAAVAATYTGWLNVIAEGEYTFATSSQNASFLLLDDQLLVDNGGAHGPQADITRNAKTKLTAGLHKLTFLHVSNGGDPVAVVAWCPPWETDKRKFTFVPPGSYAPVVRAAPGMLEQAGQSAGIDFLYDHAGESFVENRYYQRFTFNALAAGQSPRNVQWKWDFGDGQTASDPQPQHVYLVPGEYKVTLTAVVGGAKLARENRLFVSRPWDRVTENKLDGIREQAAIVQKYDFRALPAAAAGEAVILLNRAGSAEGVIGAGEAFLAADKPAANLLGEVLPLYVKALVAGGQYDAAVESLLKAAQKSAANPGVAAAMLNQAGRVALEYKEDAKAAADLFAQVIQRHAATAGAAAVRQARIGLGDVAKFQGDYARAKQAYEDARPRPLDRPGGAPFQKGDFARHVEEYIRTRDYPSADDYLERWAEAFPLDKLEGYWSLLRARMLYERGLFPQALREGLVLVKANPTSNYAAELLMLCADAYQKLKQPEKAAEVWRRVVKEYAESSLAADAAKRLAGK